MRHYLTALMLLGSGETALQPGLRSFLEKRVSAALAGGSGGRRLERGQAVHPAAPGLVNGLVAASPSSGDACAAWVHRTAMQAVAALENEPSLGEATVAGSLGLLDLAGAQADRRAAALRMYNVINGHHLNMRRAAAAAEGEDSDGVSAEAEERGGGGGDGDGGGAEAWGSEERLRGYAAAATQIGTRDWVRAGIDWSVRQADAFYCEIQSPRDNLRETISPCRRTPSTARARVAGSPSARRCASHTAEAAGHRPTRSARCCSGWRGREGGARRASRSSCSTLGPAAHSSTSGTRACGRRRSTCALRRAHRDVERVRLELASCCPAGLETEPARTRTAERGGCAWPLAL